MIIFVYKQKPVTIVVVSTELSIVVIDVIYGRGRLLPKIEFSGRILPTENQLGNNAEIILPKNDSKKNFKSNILR